MSNETNKLKLIVNFRTGYTWDWTQSVDIRYAEHTNSWRNLLYFEVATGTTRRQIPVIFIAISSDESKNFLCLVSDYYTLYCCWSYTFNITSHKHGCTHACSHAVRERKTENSIPTANQQRTTRSTNLWACICRYCIMNLLLRGRSKTFLRHS